MRALSELGVISLMTYREPGWAAEDEATLAEDSATPSLCVLSEEELEQRIASARQQEAERIRSEYEVRIQCEKEAHSQRLAETLRSFDQKRAEYFERVEAEVVRLAFAISRKILGREAQADPEILGALVRIALDRMQSGPAARVCVPPDETALWERMARQGAGQPRWVVVEDAGVAAGDCVIETEMGSASFGFDAQVRGIEEAFSHLLAQRPGQ